MDVESRCKKSGQYWQWIREEAKKIGSDGCTAPSQFGECCCLQHDLCFHYGKDPRHAFQIGGEEAWKLADPISFLATNNLFAGCLPWWLRYRWIAVMTGGWLIWKRARAKDALASMETSKGISEEIRG